MPLTEYDNLTGEQKTSVTKMYADLSDLRAYLYDWDEKGYHGRTLKTAEKKAAPPPEPKKIDPEKDALKVEPKPKATRKRRSKKSK